MRCDGIFRGQPYLSAYAIAVKHGFQGTEKEWLQSLGSRYLIGAETEEDGTFTCDSSLSEIVEAFEAGRTVMLQTEDMTALLTELSEDAAVFATPMTMRNEEKCFFVFSVSTENTWEQVSANETTVHSRLSGRDAADAHPMSAITGLNAAIEGAIEEAGERADLKDNAVKAAVMFYTDGKSGAAEQNAKDYADTKDAEILETAEEYADEKDAETLQAAKTYAAGLVAANPSGTATTQLTKLKIGNIIYEIEAGGSGGKTVVTAEEGVSSMSAYDIYRTALSGMVEFEGEGTRLPLKYADASTAIFAGSAVSDGAAVLVVTITGSTAVLSTVPVYTKPDSGIPYSDLAEGVKAMLDTKIAEITEDEYGVLSSSMSSAEVYGMAQAGARLYAIGPEGVLLPLIYAEDSEYVRLGGAYYDNAAGCVKYVEYQIIYTGVTRLEREIVSTEDGFEGIIACLNDIKQLFAITTFDGDASALRAQLAEHIRDISATLTSISANFQQSGTVYTTTPLDALRSMLTVTASYSDGTSDNVEGYELSGTLAVGTSTVTVSYGGKSDTISVIVSEAPPEPVLTGITAVYSGGTVPVGTALDSLKESLVVTAHYSDGEDEALDDADYTLSGTITEGSNTITVSYDDATTTFTVTGESVSYLTGWTAVGNPDIVGNVLTPSAGNFVKTPEVFSPNGAPWKFRIGFTPGAGASGFFDLFATVNEADATEKGLMWQGTNATGTYKGSLYSSSNGSSYNVTSGSPKFEAPSACILEIEYTGSSYTGRASIDGGANWTPLTSPVASTTAIRDGCYIGIGAKGSGGPFHGTIDLSECAVWIDGALWWKAVA